MIPGNVLSSTTVTGAFEYPSNISRASLVEDYELGGTALQDPSQGHRVQPWYFHWDPTTTGVYTRPNIDGADILLHSQANVFELSAAFDQNMRYMSMCTLVDGTSRLRWYDPTIPGYTITTFSGIASCRMTLDDNRETQIQAGVTDVILTYIKVATGDMCFRAQRDRWTVEYPLTTLPKTNVMITHFGMHNRLRLQWRLRYRTFDEVIPWLP